MKNSSFVFIYCLFLINGVMAQSLDFNEKGVGPIQIGANINHLNNIKPLERHPKRQLFRVWFNDEFKYFYLDEKSMMICEKDKIQHFLIIPNRNNEIIGMTLFISDSTDFLIKKLEQTFGASLLKSESSIQQQNTTTKHFWKTLSGNTVFLTKYSENKLYKVDIYNVPIDKKSPGVSLNSE